MYFTATVAVQKIFINRNRSLTNSDGDKCIYTYKFIIKKLFLKRLMIYIMITSSGSSLHVLQSRPLNFDIATFQDSLSAEIFIIISLCIWAEIKCVLFNFSSHGG